MNYKIRMLDELLELKERIVKAQLFDKSMTEEEQKMLEEQISVMIKYHDILYARLNMTLDETTKCTVISNES